MTSQVRQWTGACAVHRGVHLSAEQSIRASRQPPLAGGLAVDPVPGRAAALPVPGWAGV